MSAGIDENNKKTLIATSSSDGKTVVRLLASVSTHRLHTSNGTGGSDLGPSNAKTDENGGSTIMAISSVDGVTPVVVYADSSGNLLIQST